MGMCGGQRVLVNRSKNGHRVIKNWIDNEDDSGGKRNNRLIVMDVAVVTRHVGRTRSTGSVQFPRHMGFMQKFLSK